VSVFFTADTHFGHQNIIKYCLRPFETADEMDEEMTQRWNSVVKPQDTVYHLGDFAWWHWSASHVTMQVERLNGHKHLIYGNHDRKTTRQSQGWASMSHYKKIRVIDQKIILFHYACRVWDCKHHGSWQLFGHSHGGLTDFPQDLSIDVGVDCHEFTPVLFEQLEEIMTHKSPPPSISED